MDHNEPSLALMWDTFTGYQRTAALKAAVELDVFTHIAAGAATLGAFAALIDRETIRNPTQRREATGAQSGSWGAHR